jgi:hypothetical protein
MPTGTALCTRALREIGALASGETMTGDEGADVLVMLNAMLDSWRVDGMTLSVLVRSVFDIAANTQTYTIGPTGTWVLTPVPQIIEAAGYLVPGTSPAQEVPVEVLTDPRYVAIPIKAQTSTLPQAIWYTRGAPLGTVTFWPKVTVATVDLVLYTRTALTSWTALATDLTLPASAEEAIVYQLARRCCPQFGRPWTPELMDLARDAMATFKRTNVRADELTVDPALRGGPGGAYDIEADR